MPEVSILVKAKDEASATFKKVGGSLQTLGKVAVLGAAAGVAALAAGLYTCAQAAAKDEVEIAKLSAAVEASGASWKEVGGTISEYLSKQQLRSAYSSNIMREGLERLTLTTGDYQKAMELLPLAMDIARAKGMDLASASELVGKVAQGNTGMLARYGIVLEEGATATEALAMMQQRFAGQAEAYAGTYAGSMELLRIQFGKIQKVIGAQLLPILTEFAKRLSAILTDLLPKVQNFIEVFANLVREVFGGDMENAISFLQNEVWEVLDDIFGREMADKIVAIGTKVLEWAKVFRTEVIPAIQELAERAWPVLQRAIEWLAETGTTTFAYWKDVLVNDVFPKIREIITNVAEAVLPLLQRAIAFVTEHWQTFAKIGAVVGTVILALNAPIAAIIGIIAALAAAWANNWGGIQDKVRGAWAFIQPILEKIGAAINWVRENILPPLAEAFSKAWGFIKDVVKAAWEGFKPHIEAMKKALSEFWTEIKPRLQEAWVSIQEAMEKVADWVVDTLIPALRDLWGRLEPVRAKIVELAGKFGDFMGSAFVTGLKTWLDAIVTLFDAMYRAIKGVVDIIIWLIQKIQELIEWIKRLAESLPPWLRPGSASPLELSIKGIGEAFEGLGRMPPERMAFAPAGVTGEGGLTIINYGTIELAPWEADRMNILEQLGY